MYTTNDRNKYCDCCYRTTGCVCFCFYFLSFVTEFISCAVSIHTYSPVERCLLVWGSFQSALWVRSIGNEWRSALWAGVSVECSILSTRFSVLDYWSFCMFSPDCSPAGGGDRLLPPRVLRAYWLLTSPAFAFGELGYKWPVSSHP
jgi:hypothetical protein